MASNKYLPIYLNDHLAAATAEGELVRRIAGAHGKDDLGKAVQALQPQIEADHRALREAMRLTGTGTDHAKRAFAYVGEKVGRLKPNGHVVSRSPLSTLIEVDALCLLADGRLAFWKSLAEAADPRLAELNLGALADAAAAQREALETHRLAAARAALAQV